MSTLTVRLSGPAVCAVRVPAALLRDIGDAAVDAVQQSLRIRVDGRSQAVGAVPWWLEHVSAFDVGSRAGSTLLVPEAITVSEECFSAASCGLVGIRAQGRVERGGPETAQGALAQCSEVPG